MKGTFVMVDGIDGSGKSVVTGSLESWARSKGLKILNIERYYENNGAFPSPEDFSSADVIVSSEPSPYYVGRAITEEMIVPSERTYSPFSLAQAFALDREIIYNKVIIPALKAGKIVFQDRGVVTSFVYQPVESRIPLIDLMRLPGNKLALDYAPDLLIITKADPEIVMQRIEARRKKTIFENLLFQRKIAERYTSMWLKQLFENMKSEITYIDTNPPKSVDETSREAMNIWEDFLKKKENRKEEPRQDKELSSFQQP